MNMVYKSVHDAMRNHNETLINSFGNVMKEVFCGAPVDQTRPAYFNGFRPLVIGSNICSSSRELNGGQIQQPSIQ